MRGADSRYTLREHFKEVWIVDGSRLAAVAKRLKLLWDVRAQVLPGCLTAFYDLYRGIVRHLAFNADAQRANCPGRSLPWSMSPKAPCLWGIGCTAWAPSLRP